MYPPMTSESLARDSSFWSHLPGPSRKRFGLGFYFTWGGMYRRRDIDIDVLADIKANAAAVEVVAGMDVEAGVDAGIGMEVDVGVDVEDEVEDEVESSDRGTMEVGVDVVAEIDVPDDTSQRVEDIKSGHRELEARSLIASGERAGLLDNVASLERSNASRHLDDGGMRLRRLETFAIMTITRSGMTPEAIEELINQRVVEALAAYEANRTAKLAVESQSQNGDDDDNRNGGNGNGNPNRNDRGAMPVARECTYHDFVKCQPLNFKGTKGVNAHKRTVGADAAFPMSWRELIKLMTEMVPEEEDRVEKFNGGLPDNIQGNVISAEPTRLQDAVVVRDNHRQQPPVKRQNVRGQNARAYTAGNNEKRGYVGTLPFCNKCKLHHEGQCTMRCSTCKKVRHMESDCKAVVATTTRGAPEPNQKGHHRNECPKLKNQTRGNKAGKKTNEARGKAYVLGGGEANPNSNVVTGTFLLNNHYASMLFDSSIDMSFMSSTFSALLDVIPSMLDISYGVKLADRRVAETNTVLRGCTLGLLGHPFNIDLMHVELGSFDVIIGMDWLANHHAVIVCDEKIVWIPYGDEVLTVQGDRSGKEKKSKLSIISYTKTQKYIKKGCQIFLA
ncbi:reverse transcriptase domain-containing protein [Tanacetum coccineum]